MHESAKWERRTPVIDRLFYSSSLKLAIDLIQCRLIACIRACFPIRFFRKCWRAINTSCSSWQSRGILVRLDTVSAASEGQTSVSPNPVLLRRLRHDAHNVQLYCIRQHSSYSISFVTEILHDLWPLWCFRNYQGKTFAYKNPFLLNFVQIQNKNLLFIYFVTYFFRSKTGKKWVSST